MTDIEHVFFDFFGTLVSYSRAHRGESHEDSYGVFTGSGGELSYETYVDQWESTFEEFVDDFQGPRAAGMRALLIDPNAAEPVPAAHRRQDVLELRGRMATL